MKSYDTVDVEMFGSGPPEVQVFLPGSCMHILSTAHVRSRFKLAAGLEMGDAG